MIQTIDFRGLPLSTSEIAERVPRAKVDAVAAVERVVPLVRDVQERGEAALREQAERFDGVSGHSMRVPAEEIQRALDECAADLRAALGTMIARLRIGSAAQIPPANETIIAPGAKIVQRWQPVSRVGLYVPGGKAVYPSSVAMNAVAAQAAGVKSLAIASPVQKEFGSVHPTILAAAALLGVTEVYAIGGAGAIAAFAYGVPEIGLERVDVVTGPGNVFVAAAKRVVNGTVGIDAEAGTTEILIIADETADPKLVAADLLSQAEHDEAAASVLVTPSERLVHDVAAELQSQLAQTEHQERAGKALAGPQSALILVDSLHAAAAVSDTYAPEHLEIHTADPAALLDQIHHAGAIFLGPYTPVSLGDYLAGSNHVLPTQGTARFQAGLGAHTFLRPQQVIEYDRDALGEVVGPLEILAAAEGLPAHGAAARIRFEG